MSVLLPSKRTMSLHTLYSRRKIKNCQVEMRWPDLLTFEHSADGIMRLLFVAVVSGILIMNSTVFETQYGDKLVDLYLAPWWRMLIVALVITAALWCPRVGIVVALLAFFYLNDMETLISPLGRTEAREGAV